jgi:hypothetical protein
MYNSHTRSNETLSQRVKYTVRLSYHLSEDSMIVDVNQYKKALFLQFKVHLRFTVIRIVSSRNNYSSDIPHILRKTQNNVFSLWRYSLMHSNSKSMVC